MTSMKSLTESPARTLQRAGEVATIAAGRVSDEVRSHRQEMFILLGTLGFVLVVALLGMLMITS